MNTKLTIMNSNLRNPDSITVVCGSNKEMFLRDEFGKIEKWICDIWNEISEKNRFFPIYPEAKIYFNIDWDCDGAYYGKVERVA